MCADQQQNIPLWHLDSSRYGRAAEREEGGGGGEKGVFSSCGMHTHTHTHYSPMRDVRPHQHVGKHDVMSLQIATDLHHRIHGCILHNTCMYGIYMYMCIVVSLLRM